MLTPTTKLSTVLFDMDGTLLDTAPDLGYALNQLLIRHQRQPLAMSIIRPFASDGSRGLLQLGFNITPADANFSALRDEFLAIYEQHCTVDTKLFDGMSTVLSYLESRSLRWGVVTNKPIKYAQEIMQYFNLAKRCACLIGGDSVAKPKPAPDSLLLACNQLNISSQECVYVGDAERDIIAAKQAGMLSIAALYGYIHADDDPKRWQADIEIYSPQEIIPWLEDN